MPTSTAQAVWEGGLKNGTGRFEARSGAFAGGYTFAARFEGVAGTTPEELLAAAHAACFSMALSAGLEKAGTPAQSISTTAACTLAIVDGAPRVTTMKLTTRGTVPGLDQAAFTRAATEAKQGCPISKALAGNVTVDLDASLA